MIVHNAEQDVVGLLPLLHFKYVPLLKVDLRGKDNKKLSQLKPQDQEERIGPFS